MATIPAPPDLPQPTARSPRKGRAAAAAAEAKAGRLMANALEHISPSIDASGWGLSAAQTEAFMDKLLSVPALTSLDLRGNELEEGTLAQMAQRLLSYDEAGCAQLRYFASDEWSLREGQCWLDLSISASAALDLG